MRQRIDSNASVAPNGDKKRTSLYLSIAALLLSALSWAWPFAGWPTAGDFFANRAASREYFDAALSPKNSADGFTSTGMKEALAFAAPSSSASKFVALMSDSFAAYEYPNGAWKSAAKIEEDGSDFRWCSTVSDKCYKIENLEFDPSHRLEDFTIEKVPLSTLLIQGSATTNGDSDFPITLLGGFKYPNTPTFFINFKAYNNSNSDVDIQLSDASYRDSKWHNIKLIGASKLLAKQQGLYSVIIPGRSAGWMWFTTTISGGKPVSHWLKIDAN